MDELDDIDEFASVSDNNDATIIDQQVEEPSIDTEESVTDPTSPDDIITDLLKQKGIQDRSKIKYENDGKIEEVDWNSLSREEQLNILNSDNASNPETDLDDSEIALINAIRNSQMNPEEYIRYIQNTGIQNYINQSQGELQKYQVDDLSDDVLFITDLIARVGEDNISDEEIQNILETAKKNEMLFKKQVDAIRNEYKQLENNNRQQEIDYQREVQKQQFNEFANSVKSEILDLKDIAGIGLEMDDEEKSNLYHMITDLDDAGVSVFGKILNNPKNLVKMAWFLLHGEDAINDINNQMSKTIAQIQKETYDKAMADFKSGKVSTQQRNNLVIKPQRNNFSDESFDDLDNF